MAIEFSSPGFAASQAIANVLMQREAQRRQAMLDEITRAREDRLRSSDAADLALRNEQTKSLIADREARALEARQLHDEQNAARIAAEALPNDVADTTMQDLLTRTGRASQMQPGIVDFKQSTGELAPGTTDTIEGATAIPGVVMRGGSQYLAARRAAEERAGAAEAAARERDAAAQAQRDFVAQQNELNRQNAKAIAASRSASNVTVNLGDQGLDMAAKMYAKTGQLPPMGMGAAAAAARARIIDRASTYNPDTDTFDSTTAPDIASNKAGYSADTQALTQLTKNAEAVKAFEQTALKNSALLRNVLGRIPGQHTPTFLNTPIRAAAQMFGDKDMSQFNALRQAVQNEYARLISNPNLVGVMTDTARKEMETVMSPNATVGQIQAALDALASEAANRRTAFEDSINGLKGRIKGGSSAPSAADLIKKYGG